MSTDNLEQLRLLAQSDDKDLAAIAQERINEIEGRKKITASADFAELIEEINKLINAAKSAGGAIDRAEISKIVNERLKNYRIGYDNLSPALQEVIGKTATMQLISMGGIATTKVRGEQRRLFDVLLSDVEAGNNSYLYGGAGTGKTYTATLIAKALNYKLVTLNCNQFTSPLDIVGGQTIDGYQEGRLTEAWGNLNLGINPRTCEPYEGAVLLLDELPKLDPNTAGILNDALSKIKDPVEEVRDCATGEVRMLAPTILNGRGQQIEKKNVYIIATGNSLLNEADKDYEANFKQDLSLQDRFAGSTYEVYINYRYELESIMQGVVVEKLGDAVIDFTWIFNFLAELRGVINNNEFTNRAFVSTRLMISFRDTFIAYLINKNSPNPIPRPKTLQISTEQFMTLFTENQQVVIKEAINLEDWYKTIEQKSAAPISELAEPTEEEQAKAELIIEIYEKSQKSEL